MFFLGSLFEILFQERFDIINLEIINMPKTTRMVATVPATTPELGIIDSGATGVGV